MPSCSRPRDVTHVSMARMRPSCALMRPRRKQRFEHGGPTAPHMHDLTAGVPSSLSACSGLAALLVETRWGCVEDRKGCSQSASRTHETISSPVQRVTLDRSLRISRLYDLVHSVSLLWPRGPKRGGGLLPGAATGGASTR